MFGSWQACTGLCVSLAKLDRQACGHSDGVISPEVLNTGNSPEVLRIQ